MLKLKNITATLTETSTPIVQDASLEVAAGSIHAVLGPNGSGKSTLALALAGSPTLETTGSLLIDGQELIAASATERALAGFFLSFQNPLALPGVKISTFLKAAVNAQREQRGEPPIDLAEFIRELRTAMELLGLDPTFASRSVNDGFSGGERKRLELVQAILLKPKVIILDEIDSGLDLDAIKTVATAVNTLREQGAAIILITHYRRILDYVKPDHVHLFADGTFKKTGGMELVTALEDTSYEQVLHA